MRLIIILASVLATACQQKLKIELIHHQELKVPSASGIVKSGNHYFVIGDDSPFLFSLDQNFKVSKKTAIHFHENMEGEIITKKFKPDFEAMEMISENEIIIFGSGSKSPQRDGLLIITVGDTLAVKEYNITSFYEALKRLPILEQHELNIEAVAFRDNHLYLFNRGRNVVFTFIYSEFLKYLEGEIPFPIPATTLFALPTINGIPAGFSGASAFTDQPYILFTASVENTPNAYDDGEVLGSFVGMMELSDGVIQEKIVSVLIPNNPNPLKVETILIDEVKSKNEASIILATDSDGGKSALLRCTLTW